ncbi:MAG: gliding motility-associated C-terminal domain-containing protein [Flavobacterium sp. JAD_PAG50586_2]|nr:MAG: gliding motility-associated C-terminal domain-containing protein [Flavobacterium sp. JAD_PAG50586_2]
MIFIVLFCFILKTNGQNVSLFNQFNGRYDFTFIGNTMNLGENNITFGCEDLLLTSSSATLNLNPNQTIQNAYLYWAGSGLIDSNVKLNGIDISAQRSFTNISISSGLPYFSAFTDVTNQLLANGNGSYTLSDLDISSTLQNEPDYCGNRTNFAGWAMIIIYRDNNLPLNQLNIYDGLQSIPDTISIVLNNLNVIDNVGSKIGFIAWEGDSNLDQGETLAINGDILSNALNPSDNAFNGTNTITGSNEMFNMDLDVYDIQGNIQIGDIDALIEISSDADVVLINAVVTKLNNQLPDATVVINSVERTCDSRNVLLNYTVSNLNSTNPLPPGTPIAVYANGVFIAYDETTLQIGIDESLNFQLSIVIPDNIPLDFEIKIVVDDTGNGTGIVTELAENNNTFVTSVSLLTSPTFNNLTNLIACNEGLRRGTFDFSSYEDLIKTTPTDTVRFYETLANANDDVNPILNTTNYVATATPKEIFVRVSDENCFSITSFLLVTRNCPPTVYNYVSVNNDSRNDSFTIKGLRDIFLDFKLEVYNRWGKLLWTGNQNTENWDGYVKDGLSLKTAADGTYFYLLYLNDIDYPEPLKGFLYIKH